MKKTFLKSLALMLMLMTSVSMWGATTWSGWIGDGAAGGAYSNKYQMETVSGPSLVNIQRPGFAEADGMYITFPDAAFGEIRIAGVKAAYGLQGAGICLYLSNFTTDEVAVVDVMNMDNTSARWSFKVWYSETGAEPASDTPGPEPEPEPTEIDWSKYGWVANSGDKFKVGALSAANMPMEVINVQQPGFATKQGIYMTFPGAVSDCSHECGIQGGGMVLYIDQFTAKETEVTVNYAGGSKTFVVYYADGTEGSVVPESKFCATPADAITEAHGSCSPLFTINTLDDGNVKIVISAGEGLDGETKFRNGGMNGAFKLNGSDADFATYFDKGKTDDYTYMLTLKDPANKPADGAIISYSGQIECRSNINTDDWSNYKLDDYVYGSKCPTDVAVTGITLDQTEASVPVNKTLTLIATIAPANAANKTVVWISSDEAIAKVVDGVVTPQAVGGPVTITARTEDGNFTATCEVTVTAAKATEPAAAPEAPTYAADKVRALYSATYSTDCNHGAWGGSQSFTKEAYGIKIVLNPGNGFVGLVDFPARDCSTMEKFHADVWVEDNARMRFVPITGQTERGVYKDLVGGQWNSIEIALNEGDWAQTTDWSNVFQLKIDNAPGLTFWINNVYFYTTSDADVEKPVMTSATLASASFTSAVINVAATDDRGVTKYIVKNGDAEVGKFVPADGKITVTGLADGTAYTLSIYAQDAAENVSDNKVDVELTTLAMPEAPAAPDVTAKDYRAVYAPSLTNMLAHDFTLKNWGSADGTKVADKGYIFYHTTNNANVVWGENNAGATAIVAADAYKGSKGGLDASAMEYMHVDIWADKAGCNSMVVVIDDRAYNAAQTLNAGWNSIDLAMSNFAWTSNPADYNADNVAWIKFVGLNNTNDVAITNVYFWISTSTTKTVSATVNIAEAGTAVVKQDGEVVTEVENGSEVTFSAEANDGYVFLGWYADAELKSTDADYVVTVDGNTTLEAKFRALNNIYCHTELTSTAGNKVIYLTMKRTAENQYQVVIDSEEEMNGFSNAYIGKINGNNEIRLNDAAGGKQNVTVSDNKHRLTVDVTSTTPIRWNSPVYINMPGEFTFTTPNQQTIEYDVTCAPAAVELVTLNQTEATIDVEGTVTLAATASPIYADNQTVVWTSNNETVATVVNGVVTGKAEGNATITATIDGKKATCTVTVALDPTVPHVAAPAVDATGKVIRAIYSDDVELAITNAEFGLNVYGNSPYEKKAIDDNNFLLYTATEDKQVISWGSGNGAANALLGKEGMTNPENEGDKGLYAADMKYLHIDIWSSEAATAFHIQNDNAIICMVDLDGSGWQSFDIDMTGKENNLKNISIIKFANTPRNTKVALDNLYFWKLEDVHATGVSLNKNETSIVEGAQETLVATIAPANATLTACTWESNNTAVATVADGVVTAVAPGEATITVTTVDGGFTATCTVTVTADMTRPQEAAPAVATDGVEIRAIYTDDVELAIAHDFGFNPWGGAPVSKQVVAANNYLLIDAATANNMTIGVNNDGTTAIIAKDGMSDPENTDNKGLYVAGMKYCHIDIWSQVAKNDVKVLINDHALTSINLTDAGWQSFDIELVDADMTAAANVRWMKVIDLPTDTKLAIDNLYFWKSNGTAAVTGVELNKTTLAMETGDEITLVATVLPAAAANKNVTWSSNAPTVADVDENGKVTALTAGNATITVTTADGGFTATCAVSVTAAVVKTTYGFAEDNGLGFDYAITFNTDKTITIVMTRLGNDKPGIVNPSVNIGGDDAGCSLEGDSWTRTTTATFVKGQTITVTIANAYALHSCNPSFQYTVGAENTKNWMTFSETADNAAAISAANGTTTDFVLGRTFIADGYWYTLCLPFDVSAEQITAAVGSGYTLAYLNNSYMKSASMLYLDFTYTDEIVAGRPYLFMPGNDVNYPVFQNVTINGTAATTITTTKASMVGFYNPTVVSGDQYFLGDENYLLKNETTNASKAFRAYFTLDESVPAGVRARVVMGSQISTDIDANSDEVRPTKFMQNGNLFIMKQGRTFNVQGQLVK